MAAFPTARIEIIEPVVASIPEGWFRMGCETGRDDEKPVHRVWVDAFELATCQVTNEEYACFLLSPQAPPHFFSRAAASVRRPNRAIARTRDLGGPRQFNPQAPLA